MTLHKKNKLIEQIFLKIWESFYENNGTSNVLILPDFESYQINSIYNILNSSCDSHKISILEHWLFRYFLRVD